MESNHVNDNECKSTSDWRSREINPFQLLKKLVYSRMHRVILVVGCVSRLWNPWGALPPTTRTLQWAETLNGYSLQSLDDRQQNFRFRPHMVLTMLFSWTNRQRNRKNSILFFFFLPTIPLTVGRENLSIIFLEEKKKFENRVSFLLIKEYYYSYAGTYVRSKFSFVRTPLRKFPRIQTHLNSNLLFEFGIWSNLYLCQSNFHHFASFTRFLSEILTNFPFSRRKFYSFNKKN